MVSQSGKRPQSNSSQLEVIPVVPSVCVQGTAAGSQCGRWWGGAQDWDSATGDSNPPHSENNDDYSRKEMAEEGKDTEWSTTEQQLENPSRQDLMCVNVKL